MKPFRPGETVRINPADKDDPLALQWNGELVTVIRRSSVIAEHVVVESKKLGRQIFNEKDLEKADGR